MSKNKNYPVKKGAEYTFAGLVCYLFDIAFDKHAPSTKKNYRAEYHNHILPRIGECSLSEITRERSKQVVADIAKSGTYDSKTLEHYAYLIQKIVETASANGFGKNEDSCAVSQQSDEGSTQLAKKRRSLTPLEEQRLIERVMKDPKQDGEMMGLALMFCLGLRNNEACVLRFSDIRPLVYYPNVWCAYIKESQYRGTDTDKVGGKTKNMYRRLPVPQKLLELCKARLAYINELVDAGKIVLPKDKKTEDLPIACKGSLEQNFGIRCKSHNLTKNGKEVLMDIVGAEVLETCDFHEILEWEVLKNGSVPDKDPTTYLLRRHLATKLYHLDLAVSEIQYILGHKIEDTEVTRRSFSIESQLITVAYKMAKRASVNAVHAPAIRIQEGTSAECNNTTEAILEISQSKPLYVTIFASEPGDTIEVEVIGDGVDGDVQYMLQSDSFKVSEGSNIDEEERRSTQHPQTH